MQYDIIGDIHGHADALKALLHKMDYSDKGGAWRHQDRQAIFVGDFIDRGPAQLETVDLVRRMLDAGTAQAVMGNHEFNAIAWFMDDPDKPGDHLRPHKDKNFKQHERFLEEVIGTPRHREIIDWALTLPLWLELDGIRVIHACWHQGFIDYLGPQLAPGNRLTEKLMREASRKPQGYNSPDDLSVYNAIETLLKGYELRLPEGCSFMDKDGHERRKARFNWWDSDGETYKQLSNLPADVSCPEKLDENVPTSSAFWSDQGSPVFVGHYWFTGEPKPMTSKVAVIDYSVARGGKLVAYRFDGEKELKEKSFCWVG